MSSHLSISVIVPVFNAEEHLKDCIDCLLSQDFNYQFEIIIIDDASTDNSEKIIKAYKSPLIKLVSLKKNKGPASTRNEGIKIAKGQYIYFLDADDLISKNSFKILFGKARENTLDLIMSDKKVIESSENQRENIFVYNKNIIFDSNGIDNEIKKRLFDPLYYHGLIGVTGRLIKRSIIKNNNLFFQEGLRYLEDEIFSWDLIAYCKKIMYLREQLYFHNLYPNLKTGISEGISSGYSVSNFKIAKQHVFNSFKQRGFSIEKAEKLSDQAFIFFVIQALVSYSRSIILKKVDPKIGLTVRKELISKILDDWDIKQAIKNYKRSNNENKWIPIAINWRINKLLEFMCDIRAKEIIKIRRKK